MSHSADDPARKQRLVAVMAKHLPPSASRLHLLDVNGEAGPLLAALRDDLHSEAISGNAAAWDRPAASVDAVFAVDYVLNEAFLATALAVLRPGGRLVIVDSQADASREGLLAHTGRRLEAAGYVRILVESALPDAPSGLLMRGEKAHTTADTVQRIQQVAAQDADKLDLSAFKGRYVHLLVEQTPNKPPWHIEPDEPVTWHALAVHDVTDKPPVLLAFSSLPKAVGFMQAAILAGLLSQVNKVGKFSKATAAAWPYRMLVNPALDVLGDAVLTRIEIDPATAEAPDE